MNKFDIDQIKREVDTVALIRDGVDFAAVKAILLRDYMPAASGSASLPQPQAILRSTRAALKPSAEGQERLWWVVKHYNVVFMRSYGIERVLIAFDRDDADDRGAEMVPEKLAAVGIGMANWVGHGPAPWRARALSRHVCRDRSG